MTDYLKWVVLTTQNAPTSRDGVSYCMINDKLYIFGGFKSNNTPKQRHETANDGDDHDASDEDDDDDDDNDDDEHDGEMDEDTPTMVESNELFEYDMTTAAWTLVKTTGNVPSARSSCAMWSVDGALYLFGGFSMSEGWNCDLFVARRDASSSDLSFVFERVEANGDTPMARDKMCCVVTGTRALIVGGFGPQLDADENGYGDGSTFMWHNDVHSFDAASLQWSTLKVTGLPHTCAAGACVINEKLFVFGGSGSRNPATRSNRLFVADLGSLTTELTFTEVIGVAGSTPPSGRSFSGVCALNGAVVVFGGKGRNNEHHNDLHIFENGAWRSIAPSGVVPSARGFFAFCSRDSQRAILFGGSSGADDNVQRFNDTFVLKVQ